MIEIIIKGGRIFTYDKNEYECQYDKKAVLIFKNGEIVALYNLDVVATLSVK